MRKIYFRPVLLLPCCIILLNLDAKGISNSKLVKLNTNKTTHLNAKAYYRLDELSGRVLDAAGKPLVNASVQIKAQDVAVYTDAEGRFEITASKGDIIVVTAKGYKTKELPYTGTIKDIVLDVVKVGEELVNVSYGTQKRETLLQSVAEIQNDALAESAAATYTGALVGRLSGLYTKQISGKPGSDNLFMTLRGQTPLVVVDGVVRDLASINVDQIATVTVLKDALSTVMYGMRGANGVLMVTTKRGTVAPKRISFTAQTGIQQAIRKPQFLNAFDYATLYNEALKNDGKAAVYTPQDLEAYRTGSDPLGHPNVDWYNKILKDKALMNRYNLNVSGGNNSARYFIDLDMLDQNGYFITDPANTYETNNSFKRYSFRSNIDVDLTKSTLLSINLFGRISNGNEPGATTDQIYGGILTTPNNAYPMLNMDNSYGGNNDYKNNLYASTVGSGYRSSFDRNLSVDFGLKQKLDAVLKGLYAKIQASFNTYYNENINRSKTFMVSQFITDPSTGNSIRRDFGTNGTQNNISSVSQQTRQMYTELSAGYENTFGPHHFTAQVLANSDSYTNSTDIPINNTSIASKFQYDLNGKYIAELAFTYGGLNRYPSGHGYGFFPAAGLGWNLHKESWMQSAASWLNQLKLRATYGRTGYNGNAGDFTYNQYYTSGNGYLFGNAFTSQGTIDEGPLANPYLTWVKASKLNVGLDVGLLKNKLNLSVDYYKNKITDILQRRGTNASSVIGIGLPLENIGKNTYSGFELSAAYNGQFKDILYTLGANISTQKSRVDYADEVYRKYPWQQRTGMPVGQPFGLIADGFYKDANDIANSPKVEGYLPVPGDIKYKDLNGDGIINVFDETAIGTTKPLIFWGANAGLSWKGFDFNILIQGVANRNLLLTGNNTWEFQNNGKGQAMPQHLDRWTPEQGDNSLYPRLTVGNNPNNDRNSTFWMKSGNYVRLKNVELGYSVPLRYIKFAKLSKARAFVNAYNLFTSSSVDRVDPEVSDGSYPNQRIINFGINLQF